VPWPEVDDHGEVVLVDGDDDTEAVLIVGYLVTGGEYLDRLIGRWRSERTRGQVTLA
jgi:hypothetical protein